MILDTREERVRLLRAGFSGIQIEALYLILNSFEVVGVDWQKVEREAVGAATKPVCWLTPLVPLVNKPFGVVSSGILRPAFQRAGVEAAPGVRA